MTELLPINTNSNISLTTVEISELTGKRHDHVMRDTKDILIELYGDGGLPKFGETYIHPQNQQKYPCYRLHKRELLILVSGYSVTLRAKIIDKLEEMESFFSNSKIQNAQREEFELQILGLKYCADILNYSESTKLELVHALYENTGISTSLLPDYTRSVRITGSASDLLKKNDCAMSAVAFNKLLIANGILKEKERTGGKGTVKKFKTLTAAGLEYGQNDASKHNPRETQPHYYEDTFMDLFIMITQEVEVE